MSITVANYDPNQEIELEDPTDPNEVVERKLMNKLALLATRMEEVLSAGDAEMTVSELSKFLALRGDLLDELDDPDIKVWLQKMRETSRCPYRRWAVE